MKRKSILLLLVMWLGIFATGGCTWTCTVKPTPTGVFLNVTKVFGDEGGPITDRGIGVLILPNTATLTGFELKMNGGVIPTDQNVNPVHQNSLTQVAICKDLFDPGTEHLEFIQTTAPVTADTSDQFQLELVLNPPCGYPIAGLGERESVLDQCFDCTCVLFQDETDLVCVIPTVSEWGLIVMTLLLLTAATIVIGRRRRPATA